jgi:hypothetical protein
VLTMRTKPTAWRADSAGNPQRLMLQDEQLFNSLNVVLPAWLLLALLPTHKLTQVAAFPVAHLLQLLTAILFHPHV